MLTNRIGAEQLRGAVEKGSICGPKHMGFNDQELNRQGVACYMTEQKVRETDTRCYEGALRVNEGNGTGVMMSFARIGATNVTNSVGYIKNIMRGEWGFKGLISTDYVSGDYYFNPTDCVINNVTFMAYGSYNSANNWTEYNAASVSRDPNMMQALYDNMHYYMYSIANSSALNGYDADTRVTADVKEWWQTMLEAFTGVFAVLGIGGAAAASRDQTMRRLCPRPSPRCGRPWRQLRARRA